MPIVNKQVKFLTSQYIGTCKSSYTKGYALNWVLTIGIYDLPIERLAEFPVITEYSQQGWWIAYFIVAMVVTCGIAYCNKWIKNNWLKL